MTVSEPKPKACPFCGGFDHCPDVLNFVCGETHSEGGEPTAWGYGCSCSAFIGPFATEDQAIAAWNARIDEPTPSQIVSQDRAMEPVSELQALYDAYVKLLEAGRDRILTLGGDCDVVQRMEDSDPALIRARFAIAAFKKSEVGQ